MSEIFVVTQLPDVDKQMLYRGLCPWCVVQLYDATLTGECAGDKCPDCGDEFIANPLQEGE